MSVKEYMAKYQREHQEEKKVYLKKYYQEHREELKKQSTENKARNKEENRLLREANKLGIPISAAYLRKIYLAAHPLSRATEQKRLKKKQWRERNKDILTAKARIWYQRSKERDKLEGAERAAEYKSKVKTWRQDLKIEVLTYYGNSKLGCIVCGESRLACLSIDHINGKGCGHRKELYGIAGKSIYYWLKENGFPKGYQTLCMNCQFVKRFFNNEHRTAPHKSANLNML